MIAVSWLLAACRTEPAPELETGPLDVGEVREVVLHTYALDVSDFRIVLDLDDLKALPEEVADDVVLLDLPMEPLVSEVLAAFTASPEAAGSVAATNLARALAATPDDLSLEGTSLAGLEVVSPQVGLPVPNVLAALFQVEPSAPLVAPDLVARAVTEGLVVSHPSSTPDGALPVTLGDLLAGFEDLPVTFGPAGDHPGFVQAVEDVRVVGPDFAVALQADANPLPFSGVDLSAASLGRVGSIGSQVDTLFDVSQPDWLSIQGLVARPDIASLTLRLVEDDIFHGPSVDLDDPQGGTAWSLAPWTLERIFVDFGARVAADLTPSQFAHDPGLGPPLFTFDLDAMGRVTFTTFADVGEPPSPGFLGDFVAEIAQARLHDGGLPEGEADVGFTVTDVALGLDAEAIEARVKAKLAEDPSALRPLAVATVDNAVGTPDVFYRPVIDDASVEDWLWFVAPEDVAVGRAARPYTYATVGFFADPELTERVSTVAPLLGDTTHEKVLVQPGDVVYAADDDGGVFGIAVGDKPSRSRVALTVERIR